MSLQGKITLIKRWIGIMLGKNRVAVVQSVGKYYRKGEIAGYYNDLTGKVNDKTLLDEDGITVNRIEGDKIVYFPISIFQYALGLWDLYLNDKNEERRRQFLKQCEWILKNQAEDGSWNCFEPIGYKKYTVSSMGQGEAISVLVRAYELTKDKKWLMAVRKAMAFMIIEIKDGGTLLIDGDDYFFEEYPDEIGGKRSVLNGWIFSLFGIYDYLNLIDDNDIKKIFDKSINTLKKHLKEYDLGYWSYYDKAGRIASPAYHDLHIALLITLSDLTGEEEFKNIAHKWEGYTRNSLNRTRAIVKKAIQKLGESPEGIIIQ